MDWKFINTSTISKHNMDQSVTTISYPPVHDDNKSIIENIREAVYRCQNFSSKNCNKCELSGKIYTEDDPVYLYTLAGVHIFSNHHCYGTILVHDDNLKYLEDANILYECENRFIQYHNFQDIKIKFSRSNGDIQEGFIKPETPIEYSEHYECLGVRVFFENDNLEMQKFVPFIDKYSERLEKESPGLITNNKDFFDTFELKITVKTGSNFFVQERINWKINMTELLDSYGIKYTFI